MNTYITNLLMNSVINIHYKVRNRINSSFLIMKQMSLVKTSVVFDPEL